MQLSYVRNPAWTHAGGVVYRGSGTPEILLVRARPEPHDWVLPKGHIEKGEAPHECARREIREEAGVDADPVTFLADDAFTTPDGKKVHSAFFLLAFVRSVSPDEDREVRWCTSRKRCHQCNSRARVKSSLPHGVSWTVSRGACRP